jgi:hypothetical protein
MKLRENFSNKSLLVALVMLLCLILAPLSPSLAVEHSGNITSDETWLASDNPHEITANVTVNNLVTLTLEPGVEVYFNGSYSIIVNGALSAEGTEDNLIIFTRGGPVLTVSPQSIALCRSPTVPFGTITTEYTRILSIPTSQTT